MVFLLSPRGVRAWLARSVGSTVARFFSGHPAEDPPQERNGLGALVVGVLIVCTGIVLLVWLLATLVE
jgi:hypothetical protein